MSTRGVAEVIGACGVILGLVFVGPQTAGPARLSRDSELSAR